MLARDGINVQRATTFADHQNGNAAQIADRLFIEQPRDIVREITMYYGTVQLKKIAQM